MKENQGEDEGPSEMEKEISSFTPIKAVMPISMMVILIVVTLLLALWIGPYFDALGITSEMSRYADNPLYAFVFLGFVIGFAVFILVLRKLLKRRRFKLKYLFAAAVLLSSLYILTPLVDIVANGFPEVWDEYELDIDGIRGVLPLDPDDPGKGIIVVTDSSFHVLEKNKYEYDEIWKTEDLESTFDPSYSNDLWVLTGSEKGNHPYWTVNSDGRFVDSGLVGTIDGSYELLGVSMAYPNETHYLISFWEADDGNWSLLAFEPGSDGPGSWIENIGLNEGPFYPVFGWSDKRVRYTSNNSIDSIVFELKNGMILRRFGGGTGTFNFTWCMVQGDNTLFWSPDPFLEVGDEYPTKDNVLVSIFIGPVNSSSHVLRGFHTGDLENGYMASYDQIVQGEDRRILEYRFIFISGKDIGVRTKDSEKDYSFTEEPLSVFQDGPDGDIYLFFDGAILIGQFDEYRENADMGSGNSIPDSCWYDGSPPEDPKMVDNRSFRDPDGSWCSSDDGDLFPNIIHTPSHGASRSI